MMLLRILLEINPLDCTPLMIGGLMLIVLFRIFFLALAFSPLGSTALATGGLKLKMGQQPGMIFREEFPRTAVDATKSPQREAAEKRLPPRS